MATCFLCGRPVSQLSFRRKVKTGEVLRRRYPKQTVSAVQQRYGMRVVCSHCAERLDLEETKRELLGHLSVIGALLLVALLAAILRAFY